MTAAIMPATAFILPDEKAFMLAERNLPAPDYRGVHRYQIIYVVRGDALAEWRQDLGLASQYSSPEVRIPGMFEHSVAELQSIAENQRLGDNAWTSRVREVQAESSLVSDFCNWAEERFNLINNKTVIGPKYRRQRNGFSRHAVQERQRA